MEIVPYLAVGCPTLAYMCEVTGFQWQPLVDGEPSEKDKVMNSAHFEKQALDDVTNACVREFIERGRNGFPLGYLYATYTVEEGFGLSAARDLSAFTLVALYYGGLVQSGKPPTIL
jgi:hypothetical protein